jgi:surface antigen
MVVVAATLAAVLVSTSAFAQGFRWLDTSPVAHFNDEDWDMLRSTARPLLDNGADGSEDSWKNPDSGSYGSIKVLNTFQKDGLRCRRTYFSNSAGGFHGTGIFNLCKVADGSWKIAP